MAFGLHCAVVMRRNPRFALAIALVSFSLPALAEEPQPASGGGKPHMQDGLELTLALGGGYFRDDFEQTIGIFSSVKGVAQGSSGSGHFGIGYAVKPGLNLGGLVSFDQVVSPNVSVEGVSVSNTDDISVGTLLLVGPYIDWYFTPGEGWHLMGALGGARITVKDDTGAERKDVNPAGAGAFVAIGYNFWIGDEWSLGALARFGGATLYGDNLTHRVATGSLLVAITFQ